MEHAGSCVGGPSSSHRSSASRRTAIGTTSLSFNRDGSPASNAELGERLVEIAEQGDGGEPKIGRRFYYLALSYGYMQPDMGASDAAKKSRDIAYKRITGILVTLRKAGRIGWGMVLDLTRELDVWQIYALVREARAHMRLAVRCAGADDLRAATIRSKKKPLQADITSYS
jgi:hypothetical protein